MSDLFQPNRPDGRSSWRVIYDLFDALKPGDEISYETLMSELGTDTMHEVYGAASRAKRELWKSGRSVHSVRGTGYRMLEPGDFMPQASAYRNRSRRQLGNAIEVSYAAPIALLSTVERDRVQALQMGMMLAARALDQHTAKLRDHEERIRRLEGDG